MVNGRVVRPTTAPRETISARASYAPGGSAAIGSVARAIDQPPSRTDVVAAAETSGSPDALAAMCIRTASGRGAPPLPCISR